MGSCFSFFPIDWKIRLRYYIALTTSDVSRALALVTMILTIGLINF